MEADILEKLKKQISKLENKCIKIETKYLKEKQIKLQHELGRSLLKEQLDGQAPFEGKISVTFYLSQFDSSKLLPVSSLSGIIPYT